MTKQQAEILDAGTEALASAMLRKGVFSPAELKPSDWTIAEVLAVTRAGSLRRELHASGVLVGH